MLSRRRCRIKGSPIRTPGRDFPPVGGCRPDHSGLLRGTASGFALLVTFSVNKLLIRFRALFMLPYNLLGGVARHDTRVGGPVASFTVWHGLARRSA